MLNEYGGFLYYPLRCPQITLPSFLLFERGLTNKFPKPSFRFLNNPIGIIPKIETLSFWGIFCRLWSKVFGRHFTVKCVCMDGRRYCLRLFKRNLHSLGFPYEFVLGLPAYFLGKQGVAMQHCFLNHAGLNSVSGLMISNRYLYLR